MKTMIRLTVAIAMMFAINNSAFAAHYEGDAGPNARYEMDTETGIMRIYGNGDLYNYHGSWTYYSSYSQLDHTGNGVTGTQNGAQYTGNSPLNTNFGTNRNPIYLRDYLTTVIIEEGITSIGAAFFYNCQKLTSITMPSSLTLINYEAFRSCKKLEQIEIGPNVEHVMGRWATECDKFNYISVNPANTHYVSIGGVLYSADTTILVCFPEALNTIEYVIPEGTVYAATDALYHLRLVQSITIPTTMVDIEYGSFDQCPNLKTLVLKSSTPPTLHKDVAGTHLTGIFVPCGEAAQYSNNGNWNSYGGGHIQNAVVVEFYVETNNIELGDVEITSRADCEGYEMTITAVPTNFGTFSHWQDGSTTNPRTIAIDKEDLSIIYRYKAFFDPKPYRITLNKTTEQLGSWFNQLNVKDYYQVSATKGSTTIATTGTTMTVTSPENTFFYGDTVTLYCDITGSGVKFSKWGDGSTDDPRVIVVKETGSYTGQLTYSAEIKSGSISIKTASNNNNYGTTSPTSQTATFGDEVTFSATPKPKYQLSYWDDEPGNRTPELTRTVIATGDKTYTAFFAKLTYNITTASNNDDWGSCSGLGTYEVDASVTLNATPEPGYRFVNWNEDPSLTNPSLTITVTENKTYTGYFEPIPYTIRFLNENGDVLQSGDVDFGTTPVYTGATPQKASSQQWNYTFDKWSPDITPVSGAKDYTATYTSSVRSYPITFKNEDGTQIDVINVNFGNVPLYNGPTPTKTPTAQYTYTFAGWTPTPTAVTGAATYTATYNSTVNQYTIRFMNGTNVLQSDKLNYGATPSYIGETPEKSATAQYTYTFDGWDSEITEVTDDKDYKAQFTETINQYTIRFLNGNEVLQTEDLDYGATPVYKGTTPTKEADAQYTYTFAGWDKNIATVTGTCDYKAQFTPTLRTYTITFKNHDGTVLSSATVDYGVVPTYTGAVPQKPADAQYTYTFSGWSPTVVAAVSNAVYTAQFSTTNVPYAINFLNWDNSPLTATQYYALNEIPSFDGTPTRPATAQYTYTFDKWDPEIAAVTKDQDYKATYSQTVNTYTITFVDDDNTTLKTLENVPYGETPVYGSDPTKAQTAQYTYSFAGWTPAITAVTGAQTYKATYNSTLRSYTITFVDGDGNATYDVLDFGEMPVAPENPEKTATAEYSYNFKGWDKPIMSVSGDATYTAQFNAIKNKYTVQFRNWNDDVLQSSEVEYGQMPSYIGGAPTKVSDAQYNYTWTNEWDKPIETVKGNTIYKATFNHTLRAYTITFVNENGSELWHHSFNYGTTPTYGGDTPTKLPTAEFTYTHSGWTPEITEVVGDAVYTATFIGTKRSYTVKFVNDDGNELESNTYLYGLHPAYNGSTPQKANTAQYTYTFSGWDPTITNETTVTGDITYTAQYSSTVNAYPITFVNYDGTELYQSQFKYGVTPEFNGVEPTKPTDGVSTFKFSGWTPALAPVTGPATYTAKFVVDGAATHTITFLDYNGNLLYTEEIEYGQMPTPADPMRSQDDHYTYEFAGWDPELAIVTAPAEYTATYNSTVRKYQITFIDGDNNSETLEVEYGELPTPTTPSKTTTDEFTYTFSGWDPTLTTVTGAKTYRAMFTPVRRKYTITFVDYDGSETKFDVPYGETPSKANPSRPADVQYTYTFTGWTPTIAPVTGAATYTATYSSTLNQYTITVLSADANMGVVSGSGTFNYNAEISITADGQTGYHFTKWNDENTSNPRGITVKGDAEYTAYFAPNTNTAYTLNIYTQNIENDDYQLETQPMTGTTNQLSSYDAPALTGFELQNYEQVNINADGSSVLSVYYNRRSYNLTWNANGGDDLTGTYTNGSVKYQAAITAPNAPTRIGFDFNGWQPNLTTMPAEDIECIALWNEKGDTPYKIEHWLQNVEGDSYTLDFVDDTKKGKTNAQTNVAAITYTGFTAETEKTVNCNINADGSGVAKIYYKRNIHTLHWMVDGVEITENCTNGNVRFGAAIIAPADPEKDGYTFAGWNSTIATTMPDENVSYTALWTPNANTAYTVNHYKQNIDGSYAATPDATDNLTGTTGSPTAAETYEYEGFTSQPFDQVQIAADGSTVINIRYTRNHHELIWNLGICTIGEEPYTESNDNIAFGTPIVAPVLTKDGYSLTWDTEIPATMPDHDLTLTAIWTANDTEYTVNHWLRTVDGTLYTLDATETLYGPTDAMTEAAAKTYTGFTAQAFNQTTIAADGSTVINIEYSRNWHSLTWNIGEGVINTETAYTHAADSVTYGQPIIAPVLIREGFSYSWNIDIPKTMPDNDIVATTVWTDTTVTVANYVVRHNQQALDGSFAIAATDTLSGFANSPTAAVALTFEGFTAQPFEQGTISTVSTTIVEIMYNRNNYNLTWNFNGGTTTGEYTSGQVLFGTPIIAPTPTKEGFGFKSWDNLPATMPAHDVTITAVWEEQPKVEPVSFTAPATFDVCEREKSIVLTNISGGKEIKFEWSIDGKVDKSQTGPEFYIPEDAPVNGTISVTGYIPNASGSARTEQIVYKQRKRITTSLWDDVITAICTNYSFESFRWYHNGTLVDTTEYYNEVGGLTGKYYLVATTESGVEICSCESDFGAAPEATMAVYPNPTVDNITVAGSLIETGATISVIDGNGK
ncbi:MAG: leucine-rich repeat protein, partial [Salinivirgaceae bacterium]|nr:leucine-rich repeat protein [Salinivirgaceae bacterium]